MIPNVKAAQVRRPQPRSVRQRFLAAGASPSAVSVAINRESESEDRMFEALDAAPVAKSETSGADLAMQDETDSSTATQDNGLVAPVSSARQQSDGQDMPAIATGDARNRIDTDSRRSGRSQPFAAAGAPTESTGQTTTAGADSATDQPISDRLADSAHRHRRTCRFLYRFPRALRRRDEFANPSTTQRMKERKQE